MNFEHDLEPNTDPDLIALAERLGEQRPLPNPGFRGELRRALVARSEQVLPAGRLRTLIVRYASAGTALLVAGAISAAGAGPLG